MQPGYWSDPLEFTSGQMGLLLASALATMFAYLTTRGRVIARGFRPSDVLLLGLLVISAIALAPSTSALVLLVVFGAGATAGFVGGRVKLRAHSFQRESEASLAALEAEGAALRRLLSGSAAAKPASRSARNADSGTPLHLAPPFRGHRCFPLLGGAEHFV